MAFTLVAYPIAQNIRKPDLSLRALRTSCRSPWNSSAGLSECDRMARVSVHDRCFGTTHADYFYGEVPVTRPMTSREINSAYEWETENIIIERFEQLNPMEVCAVLVNGHGPFVWGPTGKKAVENALALEIVAEMALKAIQLNPQVQPVSSHLLDKHFLRKHGATAYYGQCYNP
jgi:L-ribulose-5-phosphate 4-epimerase